MDSITVTWKGSGHEFEATRGELVTPIDGSDVSGMSPVALLVASTSGCLAIDVVDILEKGRQEVRGVTVKTGYERREKPPRHLTALNFDFEVTGEVDPARAERAVQLSFDTYCSVYHSLRKDVAVAWTVEVRPG